MRSSIAMLALVLACGAHALAAPRTDILATSRYNYYTTEFSGTILVSFPRALFGRQGSLDLSYRDATLAQAPFIADSTPVFISFPLSDFAVGTFTLVCRVTLPDTVESRTVAVTVLPPKPNEVKIDYATGGLIVGGLPYFPFGFYCYSPVQPTLPEEEAVRGFNMMSPYQRIDMRTVDERKQYMDRAAALGMKVNYNLLTVAGGGGVMQGRGDGKSWDEQREVLKHEVETFRDHPALLAWYISDEPDGIDVPPDSLASIRRFIADLDPYHPVTIVIMSAGPARKYSSGTDVIMTDPYPIPQRGAAEVGSVVSALHAELQFKKPVWLVPQAFGGNEWWEREPTAAELRVMTYLGILNGATGVQYFVRHGLNAFPKSVATWNECGAISLEIAELTPVLLSAEPAPGIASADPAIHARCWRSGDLTVVIAVNTKNEPAPLHLTGDRISGTLTASLPFENRTVEIQNGAIDDMIGPLGTRVYRFEAAVPQQGGASISPFNLMPNPSFEKLPSPGIPSECYVTLGGDRGATYFVDSRIAVNGHHALRLVTPEDHRGVSLGFFPVVLKRNTSYTLSVWAKASPANSTLPGEPRGFFLFRWLFGEKKNAPETSFTMSLGNLASRSFNLDTTWKEHSLRVTAPDREPAITRVSPSLSLTGMGTAWFDAMQVVPDIVIATKPSAEDHSIDVTLKPFRSGAVVRYTLDGSMPTTSSTPYTGLFNLKESAIVKGAAFEGGERTGYAEQALTVHAALGTEVQYGTRIFPEPSAGGTTELVNGILGTLDLRDGGWQGTPEESLEVTIRFAAPTPIHQIRARFLQHPGEWIFCPESVEYETSRDGEHFASCGTVPNDAPSFTGGPVIKDFPSTHLDERVRAVRVRAHQQRSLPREYSTSMQKTWLFTDEIIVK